jgi:hyperosmotically inducible protein
MPGIRFPDSIENFEKKMYGEVCMFNVFRKFFWGMASMVFMLSLAGMSSGAVLTATSNQLSDLSHQVRLELIRVPDLGVFDNLAFTLKDSHTVVLSGKVMLPIVKSGAETGVLHIPGITKVENNIEVLPLSSMDDAIRLRTYYAIYSNTSFDKYANQAIPPVRIIVKNGHVTLVGAVGNKLDENVAVQAANTVPGVFSVTDNLKIG